MRRLGPCWFQVRRRSGRWQRAVIAGATGAEVDRVAPSPGLGARSASASGFGARGRRLLTTTVLLGVAAALGSAATARAADCSLADDAYNGACGPQFEQPAWGDGAGWTDPSKYSTIQLADLTGNGVDELIARNDDGIEIWNFDTTLGQWRPAIGADEVPVANAPFLLEPRLHERSSRLFPVLVGEEQV